MAAVRELPDLVREFIDLSKTYLRQETLEPAKLLGRFAGFAIGGAVLFALGALFVGIAGMRLLRDALPDSMNWSAVGYVVAAVIVAIVAAVIMAVTSRHTSGST